MYFILNLISYIKNFKRKFEDHTSYEKIPEYDGIFRRTISNWQRRESESLNNPTKSSGDLPAGWKNKAKQIHRDMLKNMEYVSDTHLYGKCEYWATSKEILKYMKGDCEDQAIYVLRELRDAGFPDNKIGVVIVKEHAFACIHITNNDFWLLDNGYISRQIIKASEIFPVKIKGTELKPVCGFNLFDIWTYK